MKLLNSKQALIITGGAPEAYWTAAGFNMTRFEDYCAVAEYRHHINESVVEVPSMDAIKYFKYAEGLIAQHFYISQEWFTPKINGTCTNTTLKIQRELWEKNITKNSSAEL